MKFSVLIPTRNRLDLLHYAVESVRRQDYEDWELVVADNASAQDVGAYVRALDDARVRYVRTDRFLPVTENWNIALAQCQGEYVVMLGDDDALLSGYFRTQAALLERFAMPEFVYSDAIQFAYPDVIPGHSQAFLQVGYTGFFGHAKEPFFLAKESALRAVSDSMQFRASFGFNMQHYLVSRPLIESLAHVGPFYQSPYPDYYAANVLLLKARRGLVVPRPMVAIGISKASFGYFYFNRREVEGDEFLNNPLPRELEKELAAILLPGSTLNTSWLAAMETIRRNFPDDVTFPVNHRRYRFLQIVATWRRRGAGALAKIWWRLSLREMMIVCALGLTLGMTQLLPGRLRARSYRALVHRLSAYPVFDHHRKSVPYRNILEVYENVAPEYY